MKLKDTCNHDTFVATLFDVEVLSIGASCTTVSLSGLPIQVKIKMTLGEACKNLTLLHTAIVILSKKH